MKDYAKYSNKRDPNPLYKILLIFCIVMSLAGLIYFGRDLIGTIKTNPLLNKTVITEKLKSLEKTATKQVSTKTNSQQPTTFASKKTEEIQLTKPRFDFYTLLPKMKMSSTVEESPAVPKPSPNTHNGSEVFVLQIASLQSPEAAEELIGRLNLLGVETHTELVHKDGKSWIRIRSKAYTSFQTAEAAQERLHQHHISSFLVKTKK